MRLLCGSESWVLWEQIRWSCIDPRVATLILNLLRVLIIRHFIVLKLTHLVHYKLPATNEHSRCRPIPNVPYLLQVLHMQTYSRCSRPIASVPYLFQVFQTYFNFSRNNPFYFHSDLFLVSKTYCR